MMIGERSHGNPTVHVPPWTLPPYPTAGMILAAYPTALPCHLNDVDVESDSDGSGRELDLPVGVYSSDHFRMFEFKVRNCARGRSHDWTECPYAHPGEKARRRDPRKYRYSGTACTDFRRGYCRKGDACELAHGVFECWLHPDRYRTQPCKDGLNCARLVCFFAHAPDQLRVLSPRTFMSVSVPTSESPMANSVSRSLGSNSIKEMVASLRQLQLNNVKSSGYPLSLTRPGFCSLPSTPTRVGTRRGIGFMELWDKDGDEEPVMERVESGRPLREKMFEKLSKDNPLHRVDPNPSDASNLDVE